MFLLLTPHPAPSTPEHCPNYPVVRCNNTPVCSAANATVSLLGACTVSDPRFDLLYIVDGQYAVAATCPAPGQALKVSVKPFLAGSPDCCYQIGKSFNLTSEQRCVLLRAPLWPISKVNARGPLPPWLLAAGPLFPRLEPHRAPSTAPPFASRSITWHPTAMPGVAQAHVHGAGVLGPQRDGGAVWDVHLQRPGRQPRVLRWRPTGLHGPMPSCGRVTGGGGQACVPATGRHVPVQYVDRLHAAGWVHRGVPLLRGRTASVRPRQPLYEACRPFADVSPALVPRKSQVPLCRHARACQ